MIEKRGNEGSASKAAARNRRDVIDLQQGIATIFGGNFLQPEHDADAKICRPRATPGNGNRRRQIGILRRALLHRFVITHVHRWKLFAIFHKLRPIQVDVPIATAEKEKREEEQEFMAVHYHD